MYLVRHRNSVVAVIRHVLAWDTPVIALVLLSVVALVNAQQRTFDESWRWAHFTTESGLACNNVLNVVETPDGTLWAVCDSGISWYDGFQWQAGHIPSSQRWTKNSITDTWHNDSIVVATGDSVDGWSHHYLGGKAGFTELPPSLKHEVYFLSGDTILISCNFFLTFVKTDLLHPQEQSLILKKDDIDWTTKTTAGNVWILTRDGIFKWQEKHWRAVLRTHGDALQGVTIAENARGDAIIDIEAPPKWLGLWRWSPASPTAVRIPPASVNWPWVAVSPDGQIVCARASGESRWFTSGVWKSSPTLQSRCRHVQSLFFRRNGDLVIAATDGIQYFNASSPRWQILRYGPADDWESVNEILITREGETWLGTSNGIVVYGNDGRRKVTTSVDQVAVASITGMAEDERGDVWVSSGSSFGGTYRWDGSSWQHLPIVSDSDEARFHKIRKDRQGRLWFLGISKFSASPKSQPPGAFVYENNQFTRWGHEEGLAHDRVYAFEEDDLGGRWFGTWNGISRWYQGKWQHWTTMQGLHATRVFTLAVDRHRNLWFGHESFGQGLGCIDSSGKIRYYTTVDGLPDDRVWEVRVDSQDIVWITTDGGLAKYDRGAIASYNEQTGLSTNLLWPVLPLNDKVYVGTRGQGLAILNRKESSRPTPRIAIGKPIIEGRDVHLNWRAYSYWGGLFPTEILTRYRVDDGRWSDWSKVRDVKIEKLTSGQHALVVQAKGLFGDYDPEGQQALFLIPPPLLLQPIVLHPMLVLGLSLLALGFVFINRRRRYNIELRQRESRFRSVTELTSSAIFIYDASRIHFMNTSAEALTGRRLEDAGTLCIADLIFPDDRESFLSHCSPATEPGQERSRCEIRIVSRTGEIRWLDFTSGPISYQDVEMQLGTAFNITDRKNADEKLRALTSELITTEERERRRVAIYLHDVIGQELALAKIKIRSMQKSGSASNKETDLREILHLVDDSIRNTRSLTFDLSPPVLYELNFPAAMRSLVEQLLEPHAIQLDFSYDGAPIILRDEFKVVAYHVVREIIMNCIKHAQATHVALVLTVENDTLLIAVADDGIGFNMERGEAVPGSKHGFGLFNIRERLAHLGGSLELNSNEGQGTKATIMIPMKINSSEATR